jgi:hypothetical protein
MLTLFNSFRKFTYLIELGVCVGLVDTSSIFSKSQNLTVLKIKIFIETFKKEFKLLKLTDQNYQMLIRIHLDEIEEYLLNPCVLLILLIIYQLLDPKSKINFQEIKISLSLSLSKIYFY